MISTLFVLLVIVHIALQIYDVISTIEARRLGAVERFWLARLALKFGNPGLIVMKASIATAILYSLVRLHADSPLMTLGAIALADLFYIWIAQNNFKVIRILRTGHYR